MIYAGLIERRAAVLDRVYGWLLGFNAVPGKGRGDKEGVRLQWRFKKTPFKLSGLHPAPRSDLPPNTSFIARCFLCLTQTRGSASLHPALLSAVPAGTFST